MTYTEKLGATCTRTPQGKRYALLTEAQHALLDTCNHTDAPDLAKALRYVHDVVIYQATDFDLSSEARFYLYTVKHLWEHLDQIAAESSSLTSKIINYEPSNL